LINASTAALSIGLGFALQEIVANSLTLILHSYLDSMGNRLAVITALHRAIKEKLGRRRHLHRLSTTRFASGQQIAFGSADYARLLAHTTRTRVIETIGPSAPAPSAATPLRRRSGKRRDSLDH
jgi:hypothetical protein